MYDHLLPGKSGAIARFGEVGIRIQSSDHAEPLSRVVDDPGKTAAVMTRCHP